LSVLGSLLGLICTVRARAMPHARRRARWLLLAPWAIGGTGIWVMHFMAMIGFSVPEAGPRSAYDLAYTIASWLIAIVVVWHRPVHRGLRQPAGAHRSVARHHSSASVVAAMHYTAWPAMRMPATRHL
jgi:NO-binding membrane sensor protein with MHYT domain